MAGELRLRRGTTAQHETFTGALGEATVDTESKALMLHDGSTVGGFVAGQHVYVDNIKELNSKPKRPNVVYNVRQFWEGTGYGSKQLVWNPSTPKTSHNGISVIDPDKVSELGNTGVFGAYFTPAASGNGCFHVKDAKGEIDASQAGVVYGESSTTFYDEPFEKFYTYLARRGRQGVISGIISLNDNHVMPDRFQLVGRGWDTGLYWPLLSTGIGLDFTISASVPHVGTRFGDMRLRAVDKTGFQVVKFAQIYQGSEIFNLVVYGGDIGCEIFNSWVTCFHNIYIRDGGQYGLKLSSLSSSEQLNACIMDGIYVQGYETNWYYDGNSGGGRAVYIPNGASEKSRKTSMILDGCASIKFGAGFYFEGNYSDAGSGGTDSLDKTKPINVLIRRSAGGGTDGVIDFENTYFAYRDDYAKSTVAVGIYVDPSKPSGIRVITSKCAFYANTTSHIDYDIYSDGGLVSQSSNVTNSNDRYYGPVSVNNILAKDLAVQTGFTSTWSEISSQRFIEPRVKYLVFVVTTGGTTTSALNFRSENAFDSTILRNMSIPAGTYVAGDKLFWRLHSNSAPIKLVFPSAASGDNVEGYAYVCDLAAGDSVTAQENRYSL